MPEISVIIPNYNHAAYLRQRIDSVLNQTFRDFEVIILDDCSTDDSKAIIESYLGNPKIKTIIYNDVNSGSVYFQWKKGIELAQCDYIWIAESDDSADPLLLEKLIKPFYENPNLGISFCNSHWIDDKGEVGKNLSLYNESFYRKGIDEVKEKLLKYNTIQNVSSAVFKREFVLPAIKNITKFKSCGDWYLYINILQSHDLNYNNEILNNFRWYHNNTSNKAKADGLWVKEGTDILRMLSLKNISLTSLEVKVTYKNWKYKVINYDLTFKRKFYSLMNILFFYFKFVFYNLFQWHKKKS